MVVDTSYLATQVNNIIDQLHGIFDDIGVPGHEREARETELFEALADTLNNHLRAVNNEKNNLIDEAETLINTIKQMEASLDDERANGQFDLNDDDLQVTFPLNRCIASLREKYATVSKLHRERYEQVKKLVEALESYSSHLEPSFVQIELPPTGPGSSVSPSFDLSPRYVTALDDEFTRVYEEYNRRINYVKTTAEEIIKLWAELGTPQAQTDPSIVRYYRDAPEQLGLHQSDLASLREKRDKLQEEKKSRERKIKELRTAVENLWERLGVDERDQKAFLAANRGCGLRTINEFEEELARLNELKRQNLHLFVEDARCRLQELWDSLYYSEEEMLDFTPAFSDVYSDALLEAHEAEIARLEALREQRAPILSLIDKHKSLIQDRDALIASSQDASRLMSRGNKGEKRDPGKLLREEKMRKRIAKELPKVEAELRKALEKWEEEYGRPFLVHGERYLDELTPVNTKPPARSKTPSGQTSTLSRSRSQSTTTSSTKNNPPPRSATKTPTGNGTGTVRRNQQNNRPQGSNNTTKSPSKIPARVPLANMPQGTNSPERRQPQSNYSSLTRDKLPPRAPPPKMRDLFQAPNEESSADQHQMGSLRCGSVMSSRSVRPISLEDVYDDRQRPYPTQSTISRNRADNGSHSSSHSLSSSSSRDLSRGSEQTYNTGTRQISNSTMQSAASGSENWETYDDVSEPEVDATEVYYAKLRKRFASDELNEGDRHGVSNGSLNGKKFRGLIRSVEPDENEQPMRAGGSDGWTDDMDDY